VERERLIDFLRDYGEAAEEVMERQKKAQKAFHLPKHQRR